MECVISGWKAGQGQRSEGSYSYHVRATRWNITPSSIRAPTQRHEPRPQPGLPGNVARGAVADARVVDAP